MTLVDAGLPGSGRAVLEFMAALGFSPEALERILLTHRHTDHAGGAGFLRDATGASVYLHAGDVEQRSEGLFVRGPLGMAASPVDCVLQNDEVLVPGIRAIHCGGHTAGSVSYYVEASRTLFLGDMAINNVDRLSRPIVFSNEDPAAYEAGLDKLTRVDAVAGFFGHGPPVLEGLQEALTALKSRPPTPAWLATIRYTVMRLRHPRGRD